jgi:hypothetical protein
MDVRLAVDSPGNRYFVRRAPDAVLYQIDVAPAD